jgi:hypothetical protein
LISEFHHFRPASQTTELQQQKIKSKDRSMNVCIISGKVVSPAKYRGSEKKALHLIVETVYQSTETDKPSIAHVPCVIFSPPDELSKKLTEAKGLRIALQGRVSTSRFDGDDGSVHVRTEVLVFTNSVEVG